MPAARQVSVTVPKAYSPKVVLALREHEFTDMVTVIMAQNNVIITFKCTTKRLQNILHLLRDLEVGVQFGCIDVLELNTSIPFMTQKRNNIKKKRQYRVDDSKSVEEMYHQVDAQTHLTFDYLALVTCASLLAGVGMVTDSDTSVVASMIVSPLMSPIQGIVFSFLIKDYQMLYRSIRNEVLGATIAFLTGVAIATMLLPWFEEVTFPTEQMLARGTANILISGAFIAIPSGAAVAIAIAGGISAAMVGVAISAALLPPIVNSGFNLVFALHMQIRNLTKTHNGITYNAHDIVVIAFWSFFLFLSNFCIIFVVSSIFFRLKSVGQIGFLTSAVSYDQLNSYRFEENQDDDDYHDMESRKFESGASYGSPSSSSYSKREYIYKDDDDDDDQEDEINILKEKNQESVPLISNNN